MKKTLLILPCNAGAKYGDYFLKLLWKRVDARLKQEGLREQTDIAAIDCIIFNAVKDGKGSIVREDEMYRVKGYDMHPGMFFKEPHLTEKVQLFTLDVIDGLKRFKDQYQQIVIFSNVLSYRYSAMFAIRLMHLEYKTKILDWPTVGVGISHKLIDLLMETIKSDKFGTVTMDDRKLYNWVDEKSRVWGMNAYNTAANKYKSMNITELRSTI